MLRDSIVETVNEEPLCIAPVPVEDSGPKCADGGVFECNA